MCIRFCRRVALGGVTYIDAHFAEAFNIHRCAEVMAEGQQLPIPDPHFPAALAFGFRLFGLHVVGD